MEPSETNYKRVDVEEHHDYEKMRVSKNIML